MHALIMSGMHCIIISHTPASVQVCPPSQVPHETRWPQELRRSPHNAGKQVCSMVSGHSAGRSGLGITTGSGQAARLSSNKTDSRFIALTLDARARQSARHVSDSHVTIAVTGAQDHLKTATCRGRVSCSLPRATSPTSPTFGV